MKKTICVALILGLLFSVSISSASFAAESGSSTYDGAWKNPDFIGDLMQVKNGIITSISFLYGNNTVNGVAHGFPNVNVPIQDGKFHITVEMSFQQQNLKTTTVDLDIYGVFTGSNTVSIVHKVGSDEMRSYTMVREGAASSVPIAAPISVAALKAGAITAIAGNGLPSSSGDEGPAIRAALGAGSVAADKDGNIFIADGCRIRKVDAKGIITTVAGNGKDGYDGDGGPAASASLSIRSIAVDGAGNLYIADSEHFVIRKVDTKGIITTVAGNGTQEAEVEDGIAATSASLGTAGDVAVDKNGNLYVADGLGIRKISVNGIITTISVTGDESSSIMCPEVVATDGSGNIFAIDLGRILKIDPKGKSALIAGKFGKDGYGGDKGPAASATLNYAADLAIDGKGNIYIADAGNNRIRMIDTKGIITTVAGNGTKGAGGDGGPASSAALNYPSGIALSKDGSVLYIADSGNYVTRAVKLQAAAAPAIARPTAPESLKITVSGTAATLTWKAVAGATSYKVYYKKTGGSYKALTSKTAQIKITGLSKGTKYYFKVSAVSPAGEGSACKEISKPT